MSHTYVLLHNHIYKTYPSLMLIQQSFAYTEQANCK